MSTGRGEPPDGGVDLLAAPACSYRWRTRDGLQGDRREVDDLDLGAAGASRFVVIRFVAGVK